MEETAERLLEESRWLRAFGIDAEEKCTMDLDFRSEDPTSAIGPSHAPLRAGSAHCTELFRRSSTSSTALTVLIPWRNGKANHGHDDTWLYTQEIHVQ